MEYTASNSKTEKTGLIDVEDYDLILDGPINLNSEGYARRVSSKLHRIVMQRMINAPIPLDKVVDHINGDRLDNRRENLRLCAVFENNRNMKKTRGTSRYKGVYWNTAKGRWYSQIKVEGKVKYLGLFETEVEAAEQYNKAAKIYHGDFAFLNSI